MKSVDDKTKALNLKTPSRLQHKWVPPFHLFLQILTLHAFCNDEVKSVARQSPRFMRPCKPRIFTNNTSFELS